MTPSQSQEQFKTSIGGQALIEGLMMIGPEKRAMAVRLPSGEIQIEELPGTKPWAIEKIPLLRGSVKLVRQMRLGIKAMYRSADLADLEGKEAEKAEGKEVKETFFDRHPQFFSGMTTLIALGLSVLLFILLPNAAADLLRRSLHIPQQPSYGWQLLLNLLEGLIRIVVFVGYLAFTRRSKNIARVWQYHGSEHKTIACYEAREELTVEHVRRFSRFHPRCGTSFLFLVMMVSIICLSFTGWHKSWINVLIRLALLPVIAGISYELVHWAGKSESRLACALSKPGLALQRLTTEEPDDSMIEVAIAAMKAVLPAEHGTLDRW